MKAFIDEKGCIGCGMCESICPVVFEIDEEGKAQVIMQDVPMGSWELAKDARDACPASVITIV